MSDISFKYERLVDLSSDLLCIAGFDGYFKRINPAVSELLGYSMEELYARPINDFVYEEDKQLTARVRQRLTQARPLLNFENRYLTKNGDIVWLSWTSHPVVEDKVIFAIAKNITHKKKLEKERNELLATLTTVNESLRQASYAASHDLRSPINNLLAIVDLLDLEKIEDQHVASLIELLKESAQSLKTSLNVFASRLSNKNPGTVKLEEVSFAEILREVVPSIQIVLDSSDARLNVDFSRLEKILFSKIYLKSIFLNLLTNAVKYARPAVSPFISIYSRETDSAHQLVVADNGLGLDMDKVKDKIFGLHQKFHHHADSTGIGLYLVHSQVTSLGGRIEVESELNKGTKFTISFKKG